MAQIPVTRIAKRILLGAGWEIYAYLDVIEHAQVVVIHAHDGEAIAGNIELDATPVQIFGDGYELRIEGILTGAHAQAANLDTGANLLDLGQCHVVYVNGVTIAVRACKVAIVGEANADREFCWLNHQIICMPYPLPSSAEDRAASLRSHAGCMQYCDDGHAVTDFAGKGHFQNVFEWQHPDLKKLGVIGHGRFLHQIVTDKQLADFMNH